jgi:hypothetical protein
MTSWHFDFINIPRDRKVIAESAASEFFDRVAMGEGEADVVIDLVDRAILAERARCLKVASDEAEKRFENKDDYPATRVHDFLVAARAIEVGIGRRLPVTKSDIPIIEEAGGF